MTTIEKDQHFFNLEFLFDDQEILAVNKPSGLLTIPDGYQKNLPNIQSLLKERFGSIWTVHRLDKDTSGVVLFAKNPSAHRSLCLQFQKRKVHKEYLAIIIGVPSWQKYRINLPLLVNGDRQHRTTINMTKGKPAFTDIEIIKTFSSSSLVKISPHTGYTHQIRAHLSHIGYPIAGDDLYQNTKNLSLTNKKDYALLMLHAYAIVCIHPTLMTEIRIEAPFPAYFPKT